MIKRSLSILICITFFFSNLQHACAQDFSVNQLPAPGTMIGKSAPFTPLALKGLVINVDKPLELQFIVDTGQGSQDRATVKESANQLVKYFLSGLTIPEKDLWVNLSPYEKDRMIPEALGQTDLGRDLLAQDYILKQLTASLIYPEKDLGKEFWNKVYAKAKAQFGTTNIPVNAFNKVWILPDQSQVFENKNAAYVTKSTLKVMIEEDYFAYRQAGLSLSKHVSLRGAEGDAAILNKATNDVHPLASQIIREIVIPEITKEVNSGKNFAPLRQIYQALILAKWYKETIQNGLLDALYTNKNKVAGVDLNDQGVKDQIYNRYLQAYKKGAFNYIKETSTLDGQSISRKYFSGGALMVMPDLRRDGTMSAVRSNGRDFAIIVDLLKQENAAMINRSVITEIIRRNHNYGADLNMKSREIQLILSGHGLKKEDADIKSREILREVSSHSSYTSAQTYASYTISEEMQAAMKIILALLMANGKTIREAVDMYYEISQEVSRHSFNINVQTYASYTMSEEMQAAMKIILALLMANGKTIREAVDMYYEISQEVSRRSFDINAQTYAHYSMSEEMQAAMKITVALLMANGKTIREAVDIYYMISQEVFRHYRMPEEKQARVVRAVAMMLNMQIKAGDGIIAPEMGGYDAAMSSYTFDSIIKNARGSRKQLEILQLLKANNIHMDVNRLRFLENGNRLPRREEVEAFIAIYDLKVSLEDLWGQVQEEAENIRRIRSGLIKELKNTKRVAVQDKAALANDVGGIDLNKIKIKRTGNVINVQFDQAQLNELEKGGFDGFAPVISSVTRISSPNQLLGIN